MRPGAGNHPTSPRLPILRADMVRGTVLVEGTLQPARQRAIDQFLVALREAAHAQAHAQGPRLRDPAHTLDDLETPE